MITAAILVFSGTVTQLHARGETEKIVAEKTFRVNKNAELVIDHEFGVLECKNWDRDEIAITIVARIDSDNEDKIEKAMRRIKYEISGTGDRVSISCTLNNKGITNGRPNVSVDVLINMPTAVRLDVKHKFGKAYIEEVDGISKISSEYGAVTIGSLNAAGSKVKVAFGEGNVSNFEGGALSVSYSKFYLGESKSLSLNSEFSDISMEEIGQLTIKHEGGDLHIEEIDRITGKSSFGSVTIEELSTSLDIETEYGSLTVEEVSADFSDIVVSNEFGSAKIYIDDGATYTFNATSTFGSIEYPESLADITYREKTISKTVYKGIIGKQKQARSSVKLTSEYGSIHLIAH